MNYTTTYQSSPTDERLAQFISNYSDSGNSIIHLAAKISFSTGRHIEFLQEIYDQYINSCMYDTFNDYQRKEFEFLVAKYKLVRSEVYSL
jgi:hypothetical protein